MDKNRVFAQRLRQS
ncbi:hypothetical protein ACUOAQ_07805, partial [Escherichia sp. SP-MK]